MSGLLVYRAGPHLAGERLEHVFRLTNAGSGTVVISDCQPFQPCCVKAELSGTKIPRGGFVDCTMRVSPLSGTGRRTFQCRVEYSDGSRTTLQLNATVVQPIAFERENSGDDFEAGSRIALRGSLLCSSIANTRAGITSAPNRIEVVGIPTARASLGAVRLEEADGVSKLIAPIAVEIPASDGPGPKSATLRATWDDGSVNTFPIDWNEYAPYTLVPSVVTLKLGEEVRVLVWRTRTAKLSADSRLVLTGFDVAPAGAVQCQPGEVTDRFSAFKMRAHSAGGLVRGEPVQVDVRFLADGAAHSARLSVLVEPGGEK